MDRAVLSDMEKIFELSKSVADGFVVTNSDGIIVKCNPAFLQLTGLAEKEILNTKLKNIIECTCLHNNNSLTVANDESLNVHNATIICKNGGDVHMPINHGILFDSQNNIVGNITVVYIVQTNSVQQAQTEFVSTVSHELRTPLTSIKGFADTILRAGDRLDIVQQRRYIGIIKDQADRLTRLVEDLLAVSRLESRKLQLTIRAIDLESAVQRVYRNLADKTQNHQIVLKIPQGLPPVWADADRLEQILTNLIDNAIKYSPERTTVTISARVIEGSNEFVEFSVNDQGDGIPEQSLPEIFHKFTRLDQPLVSKTEGTGLGLYITKSLVIALGGSISVVSSPGSTTFSVKLPAASLEEQAARGRG
jgi:two-component system phosphate regulon sensor histidine kinase PhoR